MARGRGRLISCEFKVSLVYKKNKEFRIVRTTQRNSDLRNNNKNKMKGWVARYCVYL